MATSGNRGGGRRSKGERRFVGSRVPVDQADVLAIVAKSDGKTVSEWVADMIDEKLRHYNVEQLIVGTEGQETLPMQQLAS